VEIMAAVSTSLSEVFEQCRDMDGSLTERLDVFAAAVRVQRPAFARAVDRLVERLNETGAGAAAPKPGDTMPPFLLPDENGKLISLEGLLRTGPVAVTFHRGHWCPYCRINIRALAKAHQRIAPGGGEIVAITPERQQYAAEFKVDGQVAFPILTDMDNGYAMSLNLAICMGEEMERHLRGRPDRDVTNFQGNEAWMLPIPATFVVGRDSRIKARFVDPDYRKRMATEDLLAALHEAI
jgi:peroxiredoxin